MSLPHYCSRLQSSNTELPNNCPCTACPGSVHGVTRTKDTRHNPRPPVLESRMLQQETLGNTGRGQSVTQTTELLESRTPMPQAARELRECWFLKPHFFMLNQSHTPLPDPPSQSPFQSHYSFSPKLESPPVTCLFEKLYPDVTLALQPSHQHPPATFSLKSLRG